MTAAKGSSEARKGRSTRKGAGRKDNQPSDNVGSGEQDHQRHATVSYLYGPPKSDELNTVKFLLVEPVTGEPAYIAERPEDGSTPGNRGDRVTRIRHHLHKLGHRQLNVYITSTLGFHEVEQKYAHAVVRVEDGPGPVILNDVGHPLVHVLHRFMQKVKTQTGEEEYQERYELLKVGHVDVESHEYGVDIQDDRSLKSAQEGLRFNIVNHRKTGEAIRKMVSSADLYRMKTQAQWPDTTRIALDVESRHIAKVADYIRAMARQCAYERYTVSGLGPIKLDDGSGNIVFAGTTGGIEFRTGRIRNDVVSEVGDKKGLAALGITPPDGSVKLTEAYRELGKILRCSPSAPAASAVLFGAMMVAPLSTIDLKYRVGLFLHGVKMSGKTSLVKLLIQTQSPTARGYYETPVTVSARPGKGGTTTNGYLMVLQRAGGFLSLVDDYTVKGMDERTFYTRDEGLSIALGALYEGAPTKQSWGKLGPEFANTNGPQASFIINGEIPGTKTGSTLSRMVEVDFPPVEFGDTGGLDSSLIKELHGDQPDGSVNPESANLRHVAWSDAVTHLLQHPEEAEKAYETAQSIVDRWDDLDLRTQDLWKRCIAGLVYFETRARKVGLRTFNGLTEKLAPDLYEAAKKQSQRLGTTTETTLSKIRRIWRELMAENRISIVGPPQYNESGYEVRAWTEPFLNLEQDEEESPYEGVPKFIDSRTRLGLTQNGDTGWVPSKKIIGFIHTPPKKQGRKPVFPYRVELNSDQFGMLVRECSARSKSEEGPALDKKTVKDELIASGYARKVYSRTGRMLTVVDAEWLLSDVDEDAES